MRPSAFFMAWIGVGVEELLSAQFWVAVGQIIMIDILLGGDNAVVIALACRQLPDHLRTKGIVWGTAGAIGLRVVVFGLLVSVPIIVWGSQLVLRLMDRFPFIITLGAMLLGWIAGTMAHSDPAVAQWLPQTKVWHYGMGFVGAILVYGVGRGLQRKSNLSTADGSAKVDAL